MSSKSVECGQDTHYNPEKCCLPGIKCITPCYRDNIGNDSFPCVDKNGNTRAGEMFQLLKCERGSYNPDECCDEGDIGTQCIAPCKDGNNCFDMDGKMPIEKAMRQHKARMLMQRLQKQNAQTGSAYLYTKIVNPETGRKVNVNGAIGKRVLKNYLSLINSL